MSNQNDDPAISYDPDRRIVTIDGFRFSRELFSSITASAPGIRFRIVSRENGVVTLSQERDPLEFAAPDLLAALKAIVTEIRAYQSPECDDEGAPGAAELKAADAAIAKAEMVPI